MIGEDPSDAEVADLIAQLRTRADRMHSGKQDLTDLLRQAALTIDALHDRTSEVIRKRVDRIGE